MCVRARNPLSSAPISPGHLSTAEHTGKTIPISPDHLPVAEYKGKTRDLRERTETPSVLWHHEGISWTLSLSAFLYFPLALGDPIFPIAHMTALPAARFLASLSPSHRQMQTPLYPPPFAFTRLCQLSAQLRGFRYTEVCKHKVFVDNTQHRGELHRRGLLIPRATARPIDDNQEPFTESVPMAVDNISMDILRQMDAFHRFTRPHTVIGTAIAIVSISLLAIQSFQDFSSRFAVGLAQAMIPALFMNVYIVGLNQIFDIEIDKVNKPNLPLASGEFSLNTGISIVTIFAILSFAMGAYIGSRPLLWALSVSFILGTAYSIKLPWLRWKRSAFAAATCILAVRAIIVQIAFYLHMQSFVFGRAAIVTKPLIFATGFMCFFSIVIALFKDIPDLEGDRFFGIKSYTVRLGQERVFWMCIQLLLAAYGVATVVGATAEMLWVRVAMVLGHAVLAGVLWHYASRIDLTSKAAITGFYMFVWKLFYAEYLLIPLMR